MSEKIPKGWKWMKLGDVVIINPNETLKKGIIAKKVPMEALLPFTKKVKFFVFEKYNGGVKFKNGDTLVARITPSLENGKTVYVDLLDDNEIGFGSTEFIVLREKSGITDKQFVYYFAISNDFRDVAIKSMTGSSGRQRVQNEVVKEFEFPLPPLPEQKSIAEVLSSIDDKIDLLHRQNKTLEEMAMTLFRKWFIEDAEGDWEEVKLGGYFDLLGGFPFKSKDYSDFGKYKIITIKNVQDGYLDISNSQTIENLPQGIKPYQILEIGDILISLTGNVGRICIVDTNNCLLNQRVAKIVPKNSEWKPFAYFYFKRAEITQLLTNLAKGSAQLNLSPIETLKLTDTFPSSEIIEKFNKIVQPIFEKILTNKQQIRRLEQLRDTLLPKLMSGEAKIMNNEQ